MYKYKYDTYIAMYTRGYILIYNSISYYIYIISEHYIYILYIVNWEYK